MISGRKGDVVIKEASEFACKSGSKLGSSVRDDSIVKTKSGEYVLEKDLSDVRGGGGFVARAENYPLRETMVNHDQNGVIAVGEGQVGNKVHRNLLKGAGASGRNRGEWGNGGMGISLVGLAGGAAGDELADEGGDAGPPIVFLE